MLTPIICLTCGCPIGDIEALFHIMRKQKIQKILKEQSTNPSHASVDAGLQIPMNA